MKLNMIVVIPARGGSKRIPKKNITPLLGKPLLEYTLDAVFKAGLDCPIYVSTDDDEIADIAANYNSVFVVKRPANIASDEASTESVLQHVLDSLISVRDAPEWVMTLPPTSPFRTHETIQQFVDIVLSSTVTQDCLMSVTENRGDFWVRSEDDGLVRLFSDAPRRQQERLPLFEENSAIYITKVSSLKKTGSILGESVRSISIPYIEGFDINTIDDLKVAECLAKMSLTK